MTKDELLRLALEVLKAAYVPIDLDEQREQAITAIEAELEAKDEPDHSDELTIAYMSGLHRGKEVAQRTWVGLTDEDVYALANEHLHYQTEGYEVSGVYNLARAIEAKLKELGL